MFELMNPHITLLCVGSLIQIKISTFASSNSSRQANNFCVGKHQNRIKNGRVMPIQSWGKSGFLAYFGPKIGHFGLIFGDIDFKFVLPIVLPLIFRGNPSWKSIGPKLTTLASKKTQKWPYFKIPFCPSVNYQKAKVYPPYIFLWICLKLSESM